MGDGHGKGFVYCHTYDNRWDIRCQTVWYWNEYGYRQRGRPLSEYPGAHTGGGPGGIDQSRICGCTNQSHCGKCGYQQGAEELLDAVTQDRMLSQEQDVHFDASDLGSYVGALYDFYASHPDDIRVSHWIGLEAVNAALPDNNARVKLLRQRVAATLRAQQSGLIDPSWHPLTLISLLVSIARSWATAPLYARTLSAPSVSRASLSSNRAAAIEAARRLLTPPRKARGQG
jgi:Tetracyclin repressor-like, C-terminal domain